MAFLFKTITWTALLALAAAQYGSDEDHHHYHQQHQEPEEHHEVGFSYAKFSGPVSGPAHEIHVEDKHGHGHKIDYVAKPDYQFEYGVEDPKSKVSQNRKEHRHEDEVHGEYRVQQPDGKLRVVKYSANKHSGFQAEVLIDGKPLHEEELAKLAQEAHEQSARAHAHEVHHNHDEAASYGGHHGQTYGGSEGASASYGGEEGGEEYYHH
ncbi:cuticle protein 19-like [Uranotaenia lowii]|uniref:cuticle protein 19-like n=1 Tax=Uranotaenia lowii TaxID=190385 RepID=UPI002479389B|nr:cuticle protein 19-like [Uranotaenia lowii]